MPLKPIVLPCLLFPLLFTLGAAAQAEASRGLAQDPRGCPTIWPPSLHGQAGYVRLELSLDPQGRLLDSRINNSSGQGEFINAALDAVQHCAFKPDATRPAAGKWHLMEFHWRPDDESDKPENIEYFEETASKAQAGNREAQFELAGMYRLGIGTAKDASAMAAWLRKAATAGHAPAQSQLCVAYRDGTGIGKDLAEALRWCQAAAAQGRTDAQTHLALFYYDGIGIAQDRAAAIAWYQKAAEGGEAHAQARLAQIYDHGMGVEKNPVLAAQWYRKAAEQHHREAQHNLAVAYSQGTGVVQDMVQAQAWMRKAARQGLATSQLVLGNWLMKATPAEPAEAVLWYRRAAMQGHAGAEARLGQAHEQGLGVAADPALAFDYFQRAAGKGHVQAMRRLVLAYENGELGQAKNAAEAAIWQARIDALGKDGGR